MIIKLRGFTVFSCLNDNFEYILIIRKSKTRKSNIVHTGLGGSV